MNQVITFSADLTADSQSRTISGKIVPLNVEAGFTNMGKVIFESGSINIEDPKSIKLLNQHDSKKPIGRAVAFSESADSIDAVFSISRSARGTEALILAEEGLQSGLSIGAEIIKSKIKDGVTYVSAAILKEVSLVTEPAFKSAQVTDIAAEESVVEETIQPTESETATVDTTTPAVEATPVEAAAVEAARPTVQTVTNVRPRLNLSEASFLENSVRAQLGDESARQYLLAASDVTTTDVAGLVPTRQLTEIINNLSTAGRPSIDAISAGTLPDAGFIFQIPRVTAVPTVAVAAEGGAFSDTETTIEYLDVTVQKFAGMQLFDVEVLDRTSTAFFSELQSLMAQAYAKATNVAVRTALQTGASADATAITLPWDGAEMAGFVARASDSIYSNTLRFATGVIVSPTQWSNIMGMVDSSNRPLFMASQPQNAAGSVSQSLRGSLLGLDLYVDYSLTGVADGSIVVVNRDSYTWYESPSLQLRADKVGTGKVEVGYYGYGAIATKAAAGAFKFNAA
jgi:HK97 family phage major capsid protein